MRVQVRGVRCFPSKPCSSRARFPLLPLLPCRPQPGRNAVGRGGSPDVGARCFFSFWGHFWDFLPVRGARKVSVGQAAPARHSWGLLALPSKAAILTWTQAGHQSGELRVWGKNTERRPVQNVSSFSGNSLKWRELLLPTTPK